MAYEIAFGSIPDNMFVCHHCDNPPCFNPAHLFVGTHEDNMLDMHNKGRAASGDRAPFRVHPESAPKGERVHTAKLQEHQVLEIRRLYAQGMKRAPLAALFGVTYQNIHQIVRGNYWKYLLYKPA
jgi:hypothetical protein